MEMEYSILIVGGFFCSFSDPVPLRIQSESSEESSVQRCYPDPTETISTKPHQGEHEDNQCLIQEWSVRLFFFSSHTLKTCLLVWTYCGACGWWPSVQQWTLHGHFIVQLAHSTIYVVSTTLKCVITLK